MPRTSRQPSLLHDVGAIADLYVDLFRLMGKRITGHGLIVTYTPPEEVADAVREEMLAAESDRERVHAGR